VFGYVCYDMLHYATHHFPMKRGVFLWLKQPIFAITTKMITWGAVSLAALGLRFRTTRSDVLMISHEEMTADAPKTGSRDRIKEVLS
jgi:hypothetical protein